MGGRLFDVTVLRAFAVLSLVMWHCYCPYICWGTAESPLNGFYTKLFINIIPDANMPLFTFLAGYLFYYLYEEKGKYRDFKSFFINKVNRLLIPFWVLGSLMNLTMYGRSFTEIFYGQPNHLWYCLMLFYVYIAFWLIHKNFGNAFNNICAILSFIIVLYYGKGALGHKMLGGAFLPLYYYFYFFLGFITYKYKSLLLKYQLQVVVLCVLIYTSTVIWENSHLIVFQCTSYIIILVVVSNYFVNKMRIDNYSKVWKLVEKISCYSFGIYVFHQYILWNVTRIPDSINYIRPYMENHYVLFPILMYISVLSVSFLVTQLSLKTEVGRYLLS